MSDKTHVRIMMPAAAAEKLQEMGYDEFARRMRAEGFPISRIETVNDLGWRKPVYDVNPDEQTT